ncbi:uncharacterized protein LOC123683436 [Harmonia axyridis]|uniref:uncharacterized protein LOC123683436 n=1 Tax=Harmonia axyridis TaxID=115357 RepID=UPI001E2772F1|nr:uncharacterized protein LOC123683436 [Harmonia axyridis]
MMDNFRQISSRGTTIKKSIMKIMKRGKYIGFMQIILTFMGTIAILPINSDRTGILYIIMMIRRANVPQAIEIVNYIHFALVHYFGFQVTYCYSNTMLYFVLHLHIQYVLLIEDCRRLETDLDLSKFSDGDLDQYHAIIEKRLSSILSYYHIIDRYQVFIADLFRRPMFFVVWFGLFTLMFTSYLLLKVDLGPDVLLVFIVWISIIEVALHFVVYGQIYVDQRDALWSVLTDFQWFNWNNRNKRTYQMFLNHVNKARVIIAGGLIPFDATFLIWFGRKTVSTVAFLSTMEEINSSK